MKRHAFALAASAALALLVPRALAAESGGAAAAPSGAAAAPSGAAPSGAAAPAFSLIERSDFSRYVDGRYIGHVYRETRGSLERVSGGSAPGAYSAEPRYYEGSFFVLEETLRDMRSAARRVDRSSPVQFALSRGGELTLRDDRGFPSLRGLPFVPDGFAARLPSLEVGSSWIAPGTRALDFDDSGAFALLPFLAEYRYLGMAEYGGRKALSLSAKFATRWKPADAMNAARPMPATIVGATGTHDLDIFLDAESLSTLFVRDRFDETFALAGSKERRSGFSLYFFEGFVPLDRGKAEASIEEAVANAEGEGVGKIAGAAPRQDGTSPPGAGPGPLIAGEGSPLADGGELAASGALRAAGLELDSSPAGLVLRVRDLRFVADSDAILSSEKWRLDAIAAALKAVEGRSFLVAGHSAAVGKAAGELELSIKRAKKVTDELAARGIEASRLLYRGYGSSQPLAPNDTEEGRAENRRVEITILE